MDKINRRRTKVNRSTDTSTDLQTDGRTFRLIESIGPEGRCFENVGRLAIKARHFPTPDYFTSSHSGRPNSNTMTAKTNMKFDKFQNLACQAQQKMRNNEFSNVTLVTAENNKFEAHKVIIAVYSFVFKNMLVNEKHLHPLIFLRGGESKGLGALLDFIYCGEAEIQNDDLDKFIKLGKP